MTAEALKSLKVGDKIVKTRRKVFTQGKYSFAMEFPFTDIIEHISKDTIMTKLRKIIPKNDLITMFEMRG